MSNVILTKALGLAFTGHGTLEFRGETAAEPITITIPAEAASYLIAGLSTLAKDQSLNEPKQHLAILKYLGADIQSLVTRDRAYVAIKLNPDFEMTVEMPLDQMTNLGTRLQNAANTMREKGKPQQH